MPLVLPNPFNPTELAADTLIRELEIRYDLSRFAPIGPWITALLTKLATATASRREIGCATLRILRHAPQPDTSWQWTALTLVTCFDPVNLNFRTRFHMQNIATALRSLYIAWQTPTGVTVPQLKIIGNDLIRLYMLDGDPALRLTLDDITVFRRAYRTLRIQISGE